MSTKWTLRKAFAYFNGAKAKNPRWSWSARSGDGRAVVVTLWKDRVQDDGDTVTVDAFGDNVHLWRNAPGNRDRIRNLAWARDRCNGLFRVVMVEPKDPHATPRSIARRYPEPRLVMRLVRLDEKTGEFLAKGRRR